MRKISLKAHAIPGTGLLQMDDNENPVAMEWLNEVQPTGKSLIHLHLILGLRGCEDTEWIKEQYLEARQAAEFDSGDSKSLDLKFISKLILPMR